MRKSTMPFRADVTEIEAHRPPTSAEIRFGEGATHYKTFPVDLWNKPDGTPKCWIVCPHDGLRYYR